MNANISRREFAAGLGGIVVAFTLAPKLVLGQQPAALPGSLAGNRMLDAWIRIAADGSATVCTGKVELGQGIVTALAQIAAEELDLPLERLHMVSGDTEKTPNEGFTSGSQSIENGGVALRLAGAEVRAILLDLAGKRLGVEASGLAVADGVISAADGRKVTYGELARDADLHRAATAKAKPKSPSAHRIVGKSIARFDIPGKVTGGVAYVQDLRLPGMLHGRVVRPPSYGAKLEAIDEAKIKAMPGVVAVVRDGSFLGLIAEREEQAIKASVALGQTAKWAAGPPLPDQANLYDHLLSLPDDPHVISEKQAALPDGAQVGAKVIEATYRKPYMCHGSIGPSCAVAQFRDGKMTVWTHSQGVFPLRGNLVMGLKLPADKVHCIHAEGSGCYGHNGCRRRRPRRCAVGAGGARRPAGAPAMDARRRVRLGAVRPRHGDEDPGGARCRRPHRRLELRRVDQHPFDATGPRRQQSAGELVSGRAAEAGAARHPAATGGRRRPQRGAALRLPAPAGGAPFHQGDAAAGVRVAYARRLRECVRDRIVLRRTRARRQCGPGGVPPRPSEGPPGARRHRGGGQEGQLEAGRDGRRRQRPRHRLCEIQDTRHLCGGDRRRSRSTA